MKNLFHVSVFLATLSMESKVQDGPLATMTGKAKAATVEGAKPSQVSAHFFRAYFNLC